MKNTRISRHLFWQRLFAFLFLLLIFSALMGAEFSPVARVLGRGERLAVLFFGVDAADASQHTDTLMVGIFDSLNNYLSVLSIPRDTRLSLPGYRFHRVNEIYGYHFRSTKNHLQAAARVLEGVEYLLSLCRIQLVIPYYVQVDYSGFRRMIDLMGGLWIEVNQPMNYDDDAGGYHLHLEPGRYLMKGDQALTYVRYRGQTGDRGRIFRQQEFVREFIKQLSNPLVVLRLPSMVTAVATGIKSNLSFWDFVYLTAAVRRLRGGDIGFYILPGRTSGPYWSIKKDSAEQLAHILGNEKSVPDENFVSPNSQLSRVTVNVWNASGKKGLGFKITKFLRRAGFDVLDWGNFSSEQRETRVIDRCGKISNALAVARALGVENYHSEPSDKALVDVEVVVGQNYQGGGLSEK